METNESQGQSPPSSRTSSLAVASLVLGIAGFFTLGLTALLGLILGIIALVAIGKSAGVLKGQGLAIAGLALSAVSVVFTMIVLLLAATLVPALHAAREQGRRAVSMNNVKQLCLATVMCADANHGILPRGQEWVEGGQRYGLSEKVWCSPFDPHAGRGYALNKNLSQRQLRRVREPAKTVLVFECAAGSGPAGGPELLPDKPRTRYGYVIGFCDGHVECVPTDRLDQLLWELPP